MITTKRHRHTHGVLPLKAPPWIHNHHHQCVLSLLLIMYTIFLHQQTPSPFTTRFFNSIHNSPPLLSPPLLFNPTLFSTDFNNKHHQPISPPPANIPLHYFIPSASPSSPTYHNAFIFRNPSSCSHHTLIYTNNIPIPTYIRKYSPSTWSGNTSE
jgi:hypothetical protein